MGPAGEVLEAIQKNQLSRLEVETCKRALLELAAEESLPVIDLSPAFDGVKDRRELVIGPDDDHANVQGHRLLAGELYRAIHDREGTCRLQPRATPAAP
jgi:hypothetical protein